MSVAADRVKIRRGAEAGDVLRRFEAGDLAAPGVAGIGDAADACGGQLAVGARTMAGSAGTRQGINRSDSPRIRLTSLEFRRDLATSVQRILDAVHIVGG